MQQTAHNQGKSFTAVAHPDQQKLHLPPLAALFDTLILVGTFPAKDVCYAKKGDASNTTKNKQDRGTGRSPTINRKISDDLSN
ncbi:hypothetical protein [Rouxiella sp. Mn2063]|uniref:hypothetical protein n=1 Tax=Rouxiella sp. Mn2063 TaxID=3395262 RepID=UPI003BF59FB5